MAKLLDRTIWSPVCIIFQDRTCSIRELRIKSCCTKLRRGLNITSMIQIVPTPGPNVKDKAPTSTLKPCTFLNKGDVTLKSIDCVSKDKLTELLITTSPNLQSLYSRRDISTTVLLLHIITKFSTSMTTSMIRQEIYSMSVDRSLKKTSILQLLE